VLRPADMGREMCSSTQVNLWVVAHWRLNASQYAWVGRQAKLRAMINET